MKTDWEGKLHSKADFQELLMEIIRPVIPYYTEEKAGIDLGVTATTYSQKTIRLEAFSRILWGLVPFGQAAEMMPYLRIFTGKE